MYQVNIENKRFLLTNFQLIRAILDDPTDKTKVYLLFANKSEADILLREELQDAVKDPRIKVSYTLDQVIYCL